MRQVIGGEEYLLVPAAILDTVWRIEDALDREENYDELDVDEILRILHTAHDDGRRLDS